MVVSRRRAGWCPKGRHLKAMYRHALCVYPYRGGVRIYPPLGLEIIAARLQPYCREIDVIDLRRERGRTKDFLRPETDLVCFSNNWPQEQGFVREEVRSVPREILTVAGGRHATQDVEKMLSGCPNLDVLVRGDGEEVITEIAGGRPLSGIAGISYRSGGRAVHNPEREIKPIPEDLHPNRRLRRYVYGLEGRSFRTGLTFDSMVTTRGCLFNCRFCSANRDPWGNRRPWSARTPESVVREIEQIDADLVGFTDNTFTIDMDRVEAICDLLLQRGIRKHYVINARVEMARRPDVVRKMERAGFTVLLLGIESAQDKTLRLLRKGFTTGMARKYFRVLRRTKMLLHGFFIIGNIGETEEEMLAIPRFARELGVDTMETFLLRNEPFSGLGELVAETPGYSIAPDGRIYSDRYSVTHLRRLRARVNRSFYTPGHVLHVVKKALRVGLIRPGMMLQLPKFLLGSVLGHLRRARVWSRG